MATEVTMPQMGESIAEGTLTRWFKQPGDQVKRDEPLFEISTDKVDAEVPSPADGVLEKVLVEEGTTVEVNTVVALLGDGTSSTTTSAEPEESTSSTPPAPAPAAEEEAQETAPAAAAVEEAAPVATSEQLTEVPMPQMGESIAEGTLTRWFKKPGDSIERDEPLFEISTDKVDAEVPAPISGILAEILVEAGTTVEVNTVVARIGSSVTSPAAETVVAAAPSAEAAAVETDAETTPEAAVESIQSSAEIPSSGASHKVRSSPLVRRIAREHGISDLSVISPTGAGGRVTKGDILGFLSAAGKGAVASPAATAAGKATPAAEALPAAGLSKDGVTVEKMSVMRRKIAEHMVNSRRTSAHVHSVFEADMTAIAQMRAKHKSDFQTRNGIKLTYTPFFLKACSDALRAYPYVNASLDGDEILIHHCINIGVAVALEHGLIVPVIKNVQDLSVAGIQKSLTDLAERARSKQLLPDEVAGGTFTITNPGQFGGLFGIPIINQPQVAILGIGGIQKRPVVVDGDKIAIRDMLYMCLSYDHRLVDGALADQFMAQLKQNLEDFEESGLV
ncbi:MAG: 2-oxoglutarate dehydrogenase, E2 component, dihydrolipoamide succinyltransferase [Planctomycetota bacterium]|nr:2-oxoglutarate dehydrogenase, E2 component, dihydrolipoamide succinyltransferase [Planctomycetota bacterium]